MNELIKKLQRKMDELLVKRQTFLDTIIKEERRYTEEERTQDEEYKRQIADLEEQIHNAQEIERQRAGIPAGQTNPTQQAGDPEATPNIGMSDGEIRKYSLVRAIRSAASGNWGAAGLEREASEATAKQMRKEPRGFFVPNDWLERGSINPERRDLTVGTLGAGGYLKATDLLSQSFIDLLRNKMVVQGAGAIVLSGLVGDLAIPRQSGGATAYWVAEGSAPTESQQAVDQVPLSPKTVGAFTDLSRKLLLQSSIDVEAFVRNDLASTLALAIDYAALHGTGSGNQPTGVASQTGVAVVAIAADGGAPTWAHVVDLETEVSQDNADIGALGYITNAKVRGKLKQTSKESGTAQFVWESQGNTPLNGYRALVTSQVRSDLTKGTGTSLSAIFFGNWRDLLIGQWGALDILVDPYTGGTTGTVRVIAFQDVDVAVRHSESFSAVLDAVTT